MSDVPLRNIKTIYNTNLFEAALKSECLGYLGRKYQIRKYQVIQPKLFPKRRYLEFWDWLDFWVFIMN